MTIVRACLRTWVPALVLALALLYYWGLAARYPYYASWDMDHHTMVDCLLIQSGQLPDHVNHTGFGMYLLLDFTHRIGHALGAVSLLTLEDLRESLNPLAGAAELTDFLRFHSPPILLAIVVVQWLAVRTLLRPSPGMALLALLLLATQESFPYQAVFVRSELYAVLYTSLAFLLGSLALRASRTGLATVLLFLAGASLGLAFLTKLQAAFLLAGILLLCFVVVPSLPAGPALAFSGRRAHALLLLAAIANLALFLALSVGAHRAEPTAVAARFRDAYGPTMLWWPLVCALVILCVAQVCLLLPGAPRRLAWVPPLNVLACGFLAAFLLHFVPVSGARNGLSYLLTDFKMLFLSRIVDGPTNTPGMESGQLLALVETADWGLLLALLLLATSLIVARARGLLAIRSVQCSLALLLVAVWIGSVAIGARMTLRDLIWSGTLGTVSAIVLGLLLVSSTERHSRTVQACVAGLWTLLLLGNLSSGIDMPRQVDASRHLYGFNWFRTLQAGFHEGGQEAYGRIMEDRYDAAGARRGNQLFARAGQETPLELAFDQAVRHAEIREVARFVFPNLDLTLKEIGVIAERDPVWVRDPDYRISACPERFVGALAIDTAAVRAEAATRFDEEIMNSKKPLGDLRTDDLRTIEDDSSGNVLALLPRADLDTYVFAQRADWGTVAGGQEWRSAPAIVLSNGSSDLELRGAKVERYREIDLDGMTASYFCVVR